MQKPLVRLVAAILAVLLVVGVGVAAIAPMAGAHGDDGVLAVVSATPSGSSSTITVKLTFEGDGHPVDGATVTAVADDGAGAAIDPVPMTAAGSPGEYTARLEFPSAAVWNVRVTAVSPSATVTLTQDIAGPASTSSTPTGSTPTSGSTPGSTPASTSGAPVDGVTATREDTAEEAVERSDSSPLPWVLGIGALVVVVGAVAWVVARRGSGPDGPDRPDDSA
ncbi:MAG TPA: FixH family protein [Microthrixaceae bacterium]|nr:FixH family protein [Microthrixaceae bacterium]HMV74422.1 FixH family protein [Microthrixaceae bacterium]HMY88564.1 FixH family protein [Microthrixaceae bacterium]HNG22931.1 FixH family protein [Microthrixaceae bacterium]HNH97190.1 FixH family protein [Microthrixaceae bacterium]